MSAGPTSICQCVVNIIWRISRMIPFGKRAAVPGPAAPAGPADLQDTTIRPECLGHPSSFQPNDPVLKNVGPGNFMKYEHVLHIMAQLSRIVYCDSGIMLKVINESLGMSNQVVNQVITNFDWKFLKQRRTGIQTQPQVSLITEKSVIPYDLNTEEKVMESYSLSNRPTKEDADKPFGFYVSTPQDATCLILSASKIKTQIPLKGKGMFLDTDVIMCFKGSSTMENYKHDLLSQFTFTNINLLLKATGLQELPSDDPSDKNTNLVPSAFVEPILSGWVAFMSALKNMFEVSDVKPNRLFLTGHSLGGAHATYMAFLIARAKELDTNILEEKGLGFLTQITKIHLITFGAPCVFGDGARNTFNSYLDRGVITVDRVVSQKVSQRYGIPLLGNDIIPHIPAALSHPGYRPLSSEFYPETTKGRPYSIENIRKMYGIKNTSRSHSIQETWPFDTKLDDTAEIKQVATSLTGVDSAEASAAAAAAAEAAAKEAAAAAAAAATAAAPAQSGGGIFSGKHKAKYEVDTMSHIPNFISVAGSTWMAHFPHAEYLGMFFLGGLRMAGMKNPSTQNTAYFTFTKSGVLINYMEWSGAIKTGTAKIIATAALLPLTNRDAAAAAAAARKTRKGRKGRKTRKSRKSRR
jgi:hypothetical protein